MIAANSRHWPEYLMEALGLGLFMMSASVFGMLLEHPASPVQRALPDAGIRRALMGLAMGTTAVGLIYSPWGRRSGAHLNPSVTLTFWSLGKVSGRDAAGYVLSQFAGGAAGMLVARKVLGGGLAHPAVHYVVTRPGSAGVGWAFAGEVVISFILMMVVLSASNSERLAPWTGLFAGSLVALWITVESPVSGMSMNPARTCGSNVAAGEWTAFWIYLIAPPLAMLAAGRVHRWLRGSRPVWCAKLHHTPGACIFRCAFPAPMVGERRLGATA